jgi:hypothetical protein
MPVSPCIRYGLLNPNTDHDIKTVAYGVNPVIVVAAPVTELGAGEVLDPGVNVRAKSFGVVSGLTVSVTVVRV